MVNNELINGKFPRNPEPVEKNLSKLIKLMKSGKYDIGFAHDCDADRLAIISEQGVFYPEDTSLALITKHEGKGTFVTNTASSLVLKP
jgi:phosphomannomutase